MRIAVGLLLFSVEVQALLPRTLVFGAGSQELRLITAKLAARAGHEVAVFGDESSAQPWRRLMYGKAYAEAGLDEKDRAAVLTDTDELGEWLSQTQALLLVCDSTPLADGACTTLLKNAPNIQKLVLMSKMGVTRAKPPGPFGIGGEDAALLANEKEIAKQAASRGLPLSVVRVGTLKGGGPGGGQTETKEGDDELGLAKAYYDGLAELETYLVCQSCERILSGC